MDTPEESENRPEDDIVVFSILKDSKCAECGEELLRGGFLGMEQQKPLYLECSDLDDLVYLPHGDTALTRRSRKYSSMLLAVVVQFSRTRGRYERQGMLVEPAALARTKEECRSDETSRGHARVKAAAARDANDHEYLAEFTARIVSRFPDCPIKRASAVVAAHARLKYSGRVGRSAKAKESDTAAIDLAVRAHLRHTETNCDRLLNSRAWIEAMPA